MVNFLVFIKAFKQASIGLNNSKISTDEELVVVNYSSFANNWTYKCNTNEEAQMFSGYLLLMQSVSKEVQNVLINIVDYTYLSNLIETNKYCKIGRVNGNIHTTEISPNEFFSGNY